MTSISIIGSGNMATAIGTRAAKHGHKIELMSRNTAKAQALLTNDVQKRTKAPGDIDSPQPPSSSSCQVA
jgi:predicted dinucleotide-binding enzyme